MIKIFITKIILILCLIKLYFNPINTDLIYFFFKKKNTNSVLEKENKIKKNKFVTHYINKIFINFKYTKLNNDIKKKTEKKSYNSYFYFIKIKKNKKQTIFKKNRKIKNNKKTFKKKTIKKKYNFKNKKNKEKIIIILDPGHGGEDPGAIGKNKTLEKNIVLQIAQKLKFLINKNKKMKAYMTRNKDTFISLNNRIKIAKNKKANLFISIHTNSFKDRRINGSSIFIFSETQKKENKSFNIIKKKINKNKEKNINKINAKHESLKLGLEVLRKIKMVNNLHRNKINQAKFAVLKTKNIPSILIETAFISNPEEEKKLKTKPFQIKIAESIFYAIKIYLKNK